MELEGRPALLYLAGPMSGLELFNRPAFNLAAGKLRAGGFLVLNPAETTAEDLGKSEPVWSDWMRAAIGQLIRADGVAYLDGSHGSRGARIEMQLARDLAIPCRPFRAWLTWAEQEKYMGRLLGKGD